ncbi:hypothetical protein BV22DRAFT_799734 [Leucogyrophana mollusca]|uniref:Uncharacterized protein n=1 Tax=Leucogyrophana mollusca TaxID=85980 RepID=A0ACB8B516_9AGAM|nr:hypothetical protein BV22DRAFT_799734 [Leucogyrophana mollusca]
MTIISNSFFSPILSPFFPFALPLPLPGWLFRLNPVLKSANFRAPGFAAPLVYTAGGYPPVMRHRHVKTLQGDFTPQLTLVVRIQKEEVAVSTTPIFGSRCVGRIRGSFRRTIVGYSHSSDLVPVRCLGVAPRIWINLLRAGHAITRGGST